MKRCKFFHGSLFAGASLFCCLFTAFAQGPPAKDYAELMTVSAIKHLWDGKGHPEKWTYEQGVVLKGIEQVWKATGKQEYFDFIRSSVDYFIEEDGAIRTYKIEDYNIDNINTGKTLLFLYRETGEEKYRIAADTLREQLRHHPRTSEGGFWHKKRYPWQMWLDGLYMGEPFYAEYALEFNEEGSFDDIARQFILMEKHSRDAKTGLLYHGWDESGEQEWADDQTGRSPHFWGRAMGWYGMALVDVLDYFPPDHPKRDSLLAILNRFAAAVSASRDTRTGLWFQVLDRPGGKGNYPEASASCMFVYALAKGVRNGYLPEKYMETVSSGYEAILDRFISKAEEGLINLEGTVSVSGLGGDPYRDGSYAYYLSEPVVVNDPKGVGAFILAASEMNLTRQ
ncbi:rhamnogalacturonyl hydrolase YesR [Anseongella ginsenosidimutans]|uniref:Rhamnogalacturonyl hydrolase YesR n=1 Tax=Anseongella ginsenosidimutans TaxID=496056 RepID=A0A4V2UT95_9SPHI|nr:glycoside hydrolase family 88 protein [Anseongella ginsenosidimutans]QEC53775.1 glycosyl hydrolase family 88 [Anseongella ginsenosidimutans]TCS84917.1 rhamnogalacturonyl hydrolase YesR [Anseongella ginsenosidimutans]